MPRPASRYLLLAAVLHVALATTIFLIGHFQFFPNTFDQNGIGLTFAIDSTTYQRVANDLVEEWHSKGFTGWLNAKAPLHSRLYSISFATFGKLLGHNILAAEPLNLFYYLAILICVYFLGREVFDAQTGFIAAAIVALWPTFLGHSTQLMRDPISIACFLALTTGLALAAAYSSAYRTVVLPQLVWGLGAWVCIGALALGRMLRGLQARRAAILSAITFASVMLMYVVFRVSTLNRGQFL